MFDSTLVWFRRDLRDRDHCALDEALRRSRRVFCVFILDRELLDALTEVRDRRVEFIRESLVELDQALKRRGGALIVRHGQAVVEVPRLASELGVDAVFTNRDYEPRAKWRDASVEEALRVGGVGFELFKDQAVFDGVEVLTPSGKPYSIFTPYRNAWLKRLVEEDVSSCSKIWGSGFGKLAAPNFAVRVPELQEFGFAPAGLSNVGIEPGMSGASRRLAEFGQRLAQYRAARDFPAVDGVSRLSVHLRFGTISIRDLVGTALQHGALSGAEGAATWLSELIWRDFYFMVLDHFPQVEMQPFKPEYAAIEWETGEAAEALFAAWCVGRTGYPLVDAAMRQLNTTGYMHNRLRMVTASFLCKDLGIDWRRGEAWFARQLIDFDLSANNGGWQWAASSGCDAQPYFRIFNPIRQSEKFDPGGVFIRRFLPELAAVPDRFIHAPWRMSVAEQSACGVRIGRETPAPLVEHERARQRTLARYGVVRRTASG